MRPDCRMKIGTRVFARNCPRIADRPKAVPLPFQAWVEDQADARAARIRPPVFSESVTEVVASTRLATGTRGR